MFDVGFTELIVILAIAFLVFGPEKLPEIARTLGQAVAALRRNTDTLRREFHSAVFSEDLKNAVDKPRELVGSFQSSLRKEWGAFEQALHSKPEQSTAPTAAPTIDQKVKDEPEKH